MKCPECDTEMEEITLIHGDKDLGLIRLECPKCGYEIEDPIGAEEGRDTYGED